MREVLILISKKELRARILLIVVCLAVGLYCLYTMDKSYDPLARYPYTTDENRDVLLKYLDSDDIDYLVNQHISLPNLMILSSSKTSYLNCSKNLKSPLWNNLTSSTP